MGDIGEESRRKVKSCTVCVIFKLFCMCFGVFAVSGYKPRGNFMCNAFYINCIYIYIYIYTHTHATYIYIYIYIYTHI
jgi:hypothetical protein